LPRKGRLAMAALIREILLDIVQHRVVKHDTTRLIESGHSIAYEYLPGWEDQCIAKCDIQIALKRLVETGGIDRRDILILSKFLSGISTAELSIQYPNVVERLVTVLALLENETRYTDDSFLERIVHKYPKYTETKEAYREKLYAAGRDFTNNNAR